MTLQIVIRSLTPPEWPICDQTAWAAARRSSGRLSRGGPASHLKEVSANDIARRYGQFLDFAQRQIGMDQYTALTTMPAALVTPEIVSGYVAELNDRVSSVTVYGSIAKLRRMAELIDPTRDFRWLRGLEQELCWEMRPKPKFGRIVDTALIVRAGLKLVDKADTAYGRTALQRAIVFRNGLMIALLALCPIRLKNFHSLCIGTSLVEVGSSWWIVLKSNDTKEERPDERPIPAFLLPALTRYLQHYRPILGHDGPELWLGKYGRPMSYNAIERTITETGRATLGVPLNPHMHRNCAASKAYQHGAQNPYLASALLNHRDPVTTQAHYNRTKCVGYSMAFTKLVEGE